MSHDKKSRKRFLGGVAVLTASTAAVKIIGLFYKLPLIHLVGIDGMAFFLAAYHIYTLLFTLSTAGLPVAVSILVSKSLAENAEALAERIYRISLALFTIVGAISTAVLYFGADIIASAIEIPNAASCIRAVSPALLFVAAGSAVKGYFQGRQNMKPTAVSQIIESVGKLVLGLAFANYAVGQGYSDHVTAAYAIFGLTSGVFISTLYLFFVKLKKRATAFEKVSASTSAILRKIASISAPITLGAMVISLTSIVDTALISSRLQAAGFAESVANAMYSSYGNLSIPLFNLIPAFISPIALSAAPMIAEASERGEIHRARELLSSAFRLCALIALPASLGLSVFGREILSLLFADQLTAVNIAAPLLSALSPAVFFSCIITVSNAALQAYGRATRPIISMALGAVVKMVTEYTLVEIPKVNILGAPLSTLLCDLTIVMVNLYFIRKHTCGVGSETKLFAGTLIASVIATMASTVVAFLIIKTSGPFNRMILIIAAVDIIIYILLAAKTQAVTAADIEMLPCGEKMSNKLRKIKLIK